jgi:phage shock protein PspC (stress-responsive transcriptional regulator)
MNKRLYRSRTQKQIVGVCGGIADYFNLDPMIVRVLFVLLTLAGGPGLILYIILMFFVPEEPEFVQTSVKKIDDDLY